LINKLHHKKFFISIVLTFSLGVLSACNDSNSQKNLADKKTVKVGVLFDSFAIDRWKKEQKIFTDTLKENDDKIKLHTQDAQGDSKKQAEQLDKLIDDDYNIIAIVPIDSNELENSVKKAKEKGIIIISYDRLLMNCDCDLYLSFDNEYIGTLMGETIDLLTNVNNKKAIMLSGPTTDNNATLVNKGFKSYCESHNITIKETKNIDNWNSDLAAKYIEDNIEKVRDANIIMCGNDNIASKVIRTMKENSIDLKTKYILGQDGDLSALQNIYSGSQYMTVYKQIDRLAKKATDIIKSLSNGVSIKDVIANDINKSSKKINDGSNDIDYIKLSPIAITKNNLKSEIIEKNIYKEEEINIYSKTPQKKF